jgi:hypothetical protein
MPASGVGRAARAAAGLALLTVVVWAAACSKQAPLQLLPNVRPTIEVTQAPTSTTQPFFYSYELRWAGYDIDGHIDHFRYAIDPPDTPGADTAWVKTTENRKSFLFHSDSLSTGADQTAEGFHTIVLEAIDDRGAFSAPVSRSFTSFTIAPTVQIIQPVLNHLFNITFGPSVRMTWVGSDPDGRNTTKPVKYKFKLFLEGAADFDFQEAIVHPDSVRRFYAPQFATWDSCGGDTTTVVFRNLVPNRRYIAVVVAFDEVGAYSPVMNQDVNMMLFDVKFAASLGPKITIFNDSFSFTQSNGGVNRDPSNFIRTEVAADRPIRFGWSAEAVAGSFISGYRWQLDGNVGDETPRKDEVTDISHWSQYSAGTAGATLPAIHPPGVGEEHFFYLEAKDSNGQTSLATVQFTVVRPVFDKDLLVVDDTRLLPDRKIGGVIDRPRGVWPTAAELDTFFFARGGKPWKNYAAGTLSPTGIFSGYDYDTLGTRFLSGGTLSLQQLSHYRHVIWYTDYKASLNINTPDLTQDPMSELTWLTESGRSNPLATWVTQGGQIWMFGGGCANALQSNFEKKLPSNVYSSADGELGPGRFMYDVFGWRSEITARSFAQAQKPDHPQTRDPAMPDPSVLPDALFEKTPDTDDINVYAPNRIGTSDFYQISQQGDGITAPNEVTEDIDPDPAVTRPKSVLDTLYESVGGQLGSGRPVMTIMHAGDGSQRHVYCGFQLWYWQRSEQIILLDWVLQKVWGLTRTDVPR